MITENCYNYLWECVQEANDNADQWEDSDKEFSKCLRHQAAGMAQMIENLKDYEAERQAIDENRISSKDENVHGKAVDHDAIKRPEYDTAGLVINGDISPHGFEIIEPKDYVGKSHEDYVKNG